MHAWKRNILYLSRGVLGEMALVDWITVGSLLIFIIPVLYAKFSNEKNYDTAASTHDITGIVDAK